MVSFTSENGNAVVTIDDIDFILCTLWSHIPNENAFITQQNVSDFYRIAYKGRLMTAPTFNQAHQDSVAFLKKTNESDLETFFTQAPQINPNVTKITGVVCGCRVENIEDKLYQQIRYLDKLIDELANGRAMEKILRK